MALQYADRPNMTYTSAAGSLEEAKRERHVDAILNMALRCNDQLHQAINRTDELRGRLLGLRDPAQIDSGQSTNKVPMPPAHELAELRLSVERMGGMLEKLHSNLRDLEGI